MRLSVAGVLNLALISILIRSDPSPVHITVAGRVLYNILVIVDISLMVLTQNILETLK